MASSSVEVLNNGVPDSKQAAEGSHEWRRKKFHRPAYCNVCLLKLDGLNSMGLSCTLCKYTVHERCAASTTAACISTFVTTSDDSAALLHHWVAGNCGRCKCAHCGKGVATKGIVGVHCRWCQMTYHDKCSIEVPSECSLGSLKNSILPPTSIVLERQSSDNERKPISMENAPDHSATGESEDHRRQASSFRVSQPPGTQPLLVFINRKSGGKLGEAVLRKLRYMLNPHQVCDLNEGGPKPALELFKDVSDARILCCGGDGTVGWLCAALDELGWQRRPPIAVLPLGTYNQLALYVGWGKGYAGEDLSKWLERVDRAQVVQLDRFAISFSAANTTSSEHDTAIKEENYKGAPLDVVNVFFSIGWDALLFQTFHKAREAHPERFKSRVKNKMTYAQMSTAQQLSSASRALYANVHEHLKMSCDGVDVHLPDGVSLESVGVVNVPSSYGGQNVWGVPSAQSGFAKADMSDGVIELYAFDSMTHGTKAMFFGTPARRLAQGSSIVLRTSKTLPMHIDGEAWTQPPCTITISHKNQVPILRAGR